MDYKQAVWGAVKKIPKGKVSTYGTISKELKTHPSTPSISLRTSSLRARMSKVTPRMVGWALHNNPDPENIPCHRVVDRNGKLAENYAFGGWKGQKKRLITEGVKFKKSGRINLDIFGYSFK